MPTPFTRVLSSLNTDSPRWTLAGIGAATALAAGCAFWMGLAPLTLYEVTSSARVEAAEAVYPVASPVAGRVIYSNLAVGREVREGDILVELDSAPQELEIREQVSRQAALRAQMAALGAQIESERQASEQETRAAGVGHEESQAQAQEADIAARHAEDQQWRYTKLYEAGVLSQLDYQKGLAEAQRLRAGAVAKSVAVERASQDQLTRGSDRTARMRGFESQVAALESQLPTLDAAIARLRNEIDQRRVRASGSGKLGEAATLRRGAVIRDGEKLGAIVSAGRLTVVAQFPPDAALGRIRAGQSARVRLDGFPWIQYGVVEARVVNVGGEVRDGTVRVEMAINRDSATRIPLQHGLPGSVEVEVERSTPWNLLMRHAGRGWSEPTLAPTTVAPTTLAPTTVAQVSR